LTTYLVVRCILLIFAAEKNLKLRANGERMTKNRPLF